MLYYIHGYMSSPDSNKGTLFNETLGVKAVKYRDCEPEDLVISECLKRIKNEIGDDEDVVLIGSSLGGMLASEIALENKSVKKLILLNPALIPPQQKIEEIHDMPSRILREMKDERLFHEKIDCDIFILVGTLDDVVPLDWPLSFAQSQQATVMFLHDDHSFTQNLSRLPGIVTRIPVSYTHLTLPTN